MMALAQARGRPRTAVHIVTLWGKGGAPRPWRSYCGEMFAGDDLVGEFWRPVVVRRGRDPMCVGCCRSFSWRRAFEDKQIEAVREAASR